jgi:hypothetical protein
MSLTLPRAPSADKYRTDPDGYIRDLTDCLSKLMQELENLSRDMEIPAKAVFTVTNIAASTTTLNGATATLTEVINYLGGQYDTFLARGIIRTKAGAA